MKTHLMVFWAMTSYSLVGDFEYFCGTNSLKVEAICSSESLVITYQTRLYHLTMVATTCFRGLSTGTSALGWLT
jgi:hypothetical protein